LKGDLADKEGRPGECEEVIRIICEGWQAQRIKRVDLKDECGEGGEVWRRGGDVQKRKR
jgi:hypothetical protein